MGRHSIKTERGLNAQKNKGNSTLASLRVWFISLSKRLYDRLSEHLKMSDQLWLSFHSYTLYEKKGGEKKQNGRNEKYTIRVTFTLQFLGLKQVKMFQNVPNVSVKSWCNLSKKNSDYCLVGYTGINEVSAQRLRSIQRKESPQKRPGGKKRKKFVLVFSMLQVPDISSFPP